MFFRLNVHFFYKLQIITQILLNRFVQTHWMFYILFLYFCYCELSLICHYVCSSAPTWEAYWEGQLYWSDVYLLNSITFGLSVQPPLLFLPFLSSFFSLGSAWQRWRNWRCWTPRPCCTYLVSLLFPLHIASKLILSSPFSQSALRDRLQYSHFPDCLDDSTVRRKIKKGPWHKCLDIVRWQHWLAVCVLQCSPQNINHPIRY